MAECRSLGTQHEAPGSFVKQFYEQRMPPADALVVIHETQDTTQRNKML
jgi:hypothetical protein